MIEDINLVNPYLKERFGKKIYKLSINGGMSCPNRDGKLGTGGCVFCSEGGSGDFAADVCLSVEEQIEQAKKLVAKKLPKNEKVGYIAYFQAFTNTYAPVGYLEKIFTAAITAEQVEAISIATRPDCLEDDKIQLLSRLNKIKPVFVELGFQTADEEIAAFIRRGYENKIFDEAVKKLHDEGLEVIVHLIVGLPVPGVAAKGQKAAMRETFLKSVVYINRLPVNGVKFQLLHVLKNTDLAEYYADGMFDTLTMDEYIEMLFMGISRLKKEVVIHRMTGDGPKTLLIAPLWSGNKRMVLNTINRRIREENVVQGEEC